MGLLDNNMNLINFFLRSDDDEEGERRK